MVVNLVECVVFEVKVRIVRLTTVMVELFLAEADGSIDPDHGAPVVISVESDVACCVTALLDAIGAPDSDAYRQAHCDVTNLIGLFHV